MDRSVCRWVAQNLLHMIEESKYKEAMHFIVDMIPDGVCGGEMGLCIEIMRIRSLLWEVYILSETDRVSSPLTLEAVAILKLISE